MYMIRYNNISRPIHDTPRSPCPKYGGSRPLNPPGLTPLITLLALLDVSAVFDSVDYSMLRNRLSVSFGLTGRIMLLLSYHPIFLRPYHSLKLVSFVGANRTKNASACHGC